MPASAALPTPTIIAVGVARPSAHGQAITNTVIKANKACAKALWPPTNIHTAKLSRARPTTTGTKMPATLSTIFCTGALLPWASSTTLIIWASTVLEPTLSALSLKLPFWFRVPAKTLSPFCFSAGIGSPLIVLSSTNELPSTIVPSTAIFSPGFTNIISATLKSSTATFFSSKPNSSTVTSLGCKPTSFFKAADVFALALSSNNLPNNIKVMINDALSKYTSGCLPSTINACGKNVTKAE